MTALGRVPPYRTPRWESCARAYPTVQVAGRPAPTSGRVWEIGHNKLAPGVWKHGVCPNLLANATSDRAG